MFLKALLLDKRISYVEEFLNYCLPLSHILSRQLEQEYSKTNTLIMINRLSTKELET